MLPRGSKRRTNITHIMYIEMENAVNNLTKKLTRHVDINNDVNYQSLLQKFKYFAVLEFC